MTGRNGGTAERPAGDGTMAGLELLGLIAALAVLALPVAVVVALVATVRLKRRVAALEHALARQGAALRALQVPDLEPDLAPEADGGRGETTPEPLTSEPLAPEPPAARPGAPAAAAGADPWSAGTAAGSAPPRALPRLSALARWLAANWVYAVSALSLALAGIFFVQYGIEAGLLPPAARVGAAILFGFALIGAGEWLRRRGDGRPGGPAADLPATFAGAGLVSIFGGVIAAHRLYALIGAEAAFAGLVAAALLAVLLGWFHGAFLAAVGLIGAAAAPFAVGGSSAAPYWLYGYFALVAATGLMIDTIRRWAWVSVLALGLGLAGGGLVFAGTGGAGWFALMLVGLVFLAVCVPARGLVPDQQGAMLTGMLRARDRRPEFPTALAGATVLAASVILVPMPTGSGAESALVLLCLAALALALTIWSAGAPALSDLTLLPAAGFVLRLGLEGIGRGPLARDFAAQAIALRPPETAAPLTVGLVLAAGVAISVAAARASDGAGRLRPFWSAGAALVAPLAALVLELFWAPARVLGAYPWALHVMALAALMVALALAFARADGAADRRRAAHATLAALSLIALALFLVATKAALTLALAALVVVAAALDRRFRLPEMGWFIQAGVIALSWRLVVDPGLAWALERAALWEAIAAHGGAAAAMAAGLVLLGGMNRRAAQVFLESAFAAYAALLVNVLVSRWLMGRSGGDWIVAHWALTLNAMPWLILMLTQLYRLQLGGAMRWLRRGIALVAGLIGLGGIALAAGPGNPLFGLIGGAAGQVTGPPLLDTLLVAYAVPGLTILAALGRMDHLGRWLRRALGAIGVALLALYAGLEIRRLWRGDDLSLPGVTQPELYSYTVALMAVGAGLLYQAIARRSPGLRRAAMAVIALTVAKVFLIDAAGLSGLTRVASFLALGLSLAGLAWLNRWAAVRQG